MQEQGNQAQGIALARAGQRAEAYARLRKAIFSEGDSAELRLWLAGTAPTPAEALAHLERAADLEPDNPQVQAGFDWLRRTAPPDLFARPAPEVTPAPVAPPPAAADTGLPGETVSGAPPAADDLAWFEEAVSDPPPPAPDSTLPVPDGESTADPPVAAMPPEELVKTEVPPPPLTGDARRRTNPFTVILMLGGILLFLGAAVAALGFGGQLPGFRRVPPGPSSDATGTVLASLPITGTPGLTATAGLSGTLGVPDPPLAVRALADLLTTIRDADRDVADTVHQVSGSLRDPKEAAPLIQTALQADTGYRAALTGPAAPAIPARQRDQVLTALDNRDSALKLAVSYLDRMSEIPDARTARDNAATDYQATLSDPNTGKAITAKRTYDTAKDALDRLETRAAQDLQQFDTLWADYTRSLPVVQVPTAGPLESPTSAPGVESPTAAPGTEAPTSVPAIESPTPQP